MIQLDSANSWQKASEYLVASTILKMSQAGNLNLLMLLAIKPAASAPAFYKDWQNDSMILLRPEQHSHVGYNMHIAVGLSNQNTLLHTLQHSLSSDEQAQVPAQEEQQVYVEATVGRPCQLQSCHLKVLLRSRQDWKSAIRNCAPQ